MTRLDRLQDFFSQIATPFYVLRAPLIAALAAATFLAGPDQALEIYRALALDAGNQRSQIVLAITTLVLASVVIWYIARNLTLIWQQGSLVDHGLQTRLLRWMPRLIGAIPLAAAAVGMVRAAMDIPKIRVPASIEQQIPGLLDDILVAEASLNHAYGILTRGAWLMGGLAVALIVLTHLRSYHRLWVHEKPNPLLFSFGVRSVLTMFALVFSLALGAFYLFDPVSLSIVAGELGAFAIFNIFVLCFAFTLAFLTNIYDRTNVPVLSILGIVAIVSSAYNLNDNHLIRTLDREMLTETAGPEAKRIARPNMEDERRRRFQSASNAFLAWLEARPDKEHFWNQGRDYPVYIVSAQGGGLYAAHHAAITLARLQDRCPGFAQHVFAMSGVSGGSLGISLFSSLVKVGAEPVTEPGCKVGPIDNTYYSDAVERYLSHDFMAPLTAAGFFPDLAQRFIPFPIQRFDRARALEASFEYAWRKARPEVDSNPFAESFNDAWTPQSLHPALILNTTWVATGERMVFSPFHFRGEASDNIQTLGPLIRRPVALSTAVGVSARFPWVLPPARVERTYSRTRFNNDDRSEAVKQRVQIRQERYGRAPGDSVSLRLVDGGYFEYSGVESALDVLHVIEQLQVQRARQGLERLRVHPSIIVLGNDQISEDAVTSDAFSGQRQLSLSAGGFGEALAPVQALLGSRLARGNLSVNRAVDKLCPGCFRSRQDRRSLPGFDGEARLFRLNQTDFSLTLGWQLSAATRRIIATHAGEPDKCFVAPRKRNDAALRRNGEDGESWFAEVINENNCAACRIVYDLNVEPHIVAVAQSKSGIDPSQVVTLHPYSIRIPPGGGLICR
ncbi:MAG: hypothetical protein GC150_04660 [Rhizobiales bacterium]|nr:hypothetical protein [Hyphomicrobiales bacterium]